jgi:hypothetical protein
VFADRANGDRRGQRGNRLKTTDRSCPPAGEVTSAPPAGEGACRSMNQALASDGPAFAVL